MKIDFDKNISSSDLVYKYNHHVHMHFEQEVCWRYTNVFHNFAVHMTLLRIFSLTRVRVDDKGPPRAKGGQFYVEHFR